VSIPADDFEQGFRGDPRAPRDENVGPRSEQALAQGRKRRRFDQAGPRKHAPPTLAGSPTRSRALGSREDLRRYCRRPRGPFPSEPCRPPSWDPVGACPNFNVDWTFRASGPSGLIPEIVGSPQPADLADGTRHMLTSLTRLNAPR
jgi:hypothetical protein